jgi:hypothetical protein
MYLRLGKTKEFMGCIIIYQIREFYWGVMKGFSKIAKPLSDSTKGSPKDCKWTEDMTKAFKKLKHCFTTAPILRYFNPH